MQQTILRAAFMACLALAATAGAHAADGSVDIRAGGQPREVVVAVKNDASACGMEVRFGDGRVEKKRLEAGESWSLNHSYGADGNFTIQAEGVLVVRGLRTATGCSFGQQAVLAVAGANARLQTAGKGAAATGATTPAAAAAPTPAATAPAQQSPAAATAQPSKPTQGPQQDLLVMVNKNSRRLKLVSTLEGGKRLSNGEDLAKSGVETCLIKLPNAYPGVPDDSVEAVALTQLRRYLGELAGGKEVQVRPTECIANSGNAARFMPTRADIVLVQRQAVPILSNGSQEFGRDYEQLHEFNHTSVFAMADQLREAAAQRQQAVANRAQEFDSLAQANSTEKVGSLSFGLPRRSGAVAFCTLTYSGDQGAAILGYAQRGLATQSEEWRAAAERARATVDAVRPFTQSYPNLEVLFEARQTKPDDCIVYVDFPANLKKLATALQRDGKSQFVINQLVESTTLRDDWARRANYQDYAQYQSAREMKVNAQQLKTLAQYQISDKAGMDAAVRDMQASRYSTSSEPSDLLNYLKDKAEAAGKPGATAVGVRDARQKAAQEAADAQAASERRQREEYAKQYPYIAVLTCGMPQHLNILGCFAGSSRGVDTELKLRNGDKLNLYKVYNLSEAGQERRDGIYIDLRSSYSLQAQNSHDTLVLGLKIIERVSGRVIHNDQVARFGVVRASN
ncbi:MAG: hypothetical protein WCK08_01255 [Betaproteobacteria bacterium]